MTLSVIGLSVCLSVCLFCLSVCLSRERLQDCNLSVCLLRREWQDFNLIKSFWSCLLSCLSVFCLSVLVSVNAEICLSCLSDRLSVSVWDFHVISRSKMSCDIFDLEMIISHDIFDLEMI